MEYDQFLNTVEEDTPPKNLTNTLLSLWWDKKGDWNKAHTIAQDIPTVAGSAVHAYLHREEGELWNADYWYKRACRQRPDVSLEQEWTSLVLEMLTINT